MSSAHSPECHLVDTLNAREEEILPLLAEGLSNREIAEQLMLGYTTVKWYCQQIYDKLGLEKPYRKRRWAVHCARQLGLLVTEGDEEVFLAAGDNPYKGLDAFYQEDADLFFGREAFVEQLIDGLRDNSAQNRFLAVVGPSGSGKSSAVRAGLIPALQQNAIPGSSRWAIVTMFPRVNPFFELEAALHGVAVKHQPNLLEMLQRDAYGLARVAPLLLPEDQPLLIIIDQFEELFTLVEDSAQARRFMDLIYAAVTDPRSSVRVGITLRADFLDRPLMYPDFSWLIEKHIALVCPLTPNEMERAIVQPAKNANVSIESGVIAKILADANEQPGALPLLQFALTELYDSRIGPIITMNTYEEVGGLRQTLTTQAEKIYDTFTDDQQEITRQLFLRLITLGEGSEDVRRRVPLPDLSSMDVSSEALDYVIQFLTANRLLTVDLDLTTKTPTVEVAHEALIREWARLRGWLNESRNDVRMERLLATATNEWNRHERDVSFLMRGARLAQFRGWQEATSIALTTAERDFLEESVVEHERQQRQRRTLRNIVLAAASLVAVIMGILAFTANNERSRAESAEDDALFQAGVLLAAQAESELENGFTDRAALLALEALENYPYSPQAERALGRAVSYNRALQQYTGHESAVTSADWSPDGTKIATTSTDNTVHVWDAATGEQLLVIDLPEGITGNMFDWGLAVKWTLDGDRLLTITGDRILLGSQDYDMMLWDATTGEQLHAVELSNQAEPTAGEGVVTSAEHYFTGDAAAFAENSGWLATVGGDNTAFIWTTDFQQPALILEGHSDAVNSVAWSPNETQIATASEDGTIRLWDAETGEENIALAGHTGAVNQAVWSPDGLFVASAGDDGTMQIWETASGSSLQTIAPEAGIVWSVAWSSDGAYLATATNDAVVRIWELASGDVVAELRGHQNFVLHLAWSSDNNQLISTGSEGIVRIWNAAASTAYLRFPYQYTNGLDWSSNGQFLALGTGDWWGGIEPDNLTIWEPSQARLVSDQLTSRDGWVMYQPYYSSDDTQLLIMAMKGPFATLSENEWEPAAFVVDTRTGEEVRTLTIDEVGLIRTTAWSPDDSYVAGGTSNGTLAVWDYETGERRYTDTCGEWINSVAWSPDGTKLAIDCQEFSNPWNSWVEVFDTSTYELLFTVPDIAPSAMITFIAWSPDSSRLLITGGSDEFGTKVNPIRIVDGNTGEELLLIIRHTGQVWWGSWSPNGERIATGSTDDTTRIWDVETGAELLTISTPNNWSVMMEWSPDGRYLAVSMYSFDEPGGAEIWRVWQNTDELIAYARECCIFRDLTDEERDQFALSRHK